MISVSFVRRLRHRYRIAERYSMPVPQCCRICFTMGLFVTELLLTVLDGTFRRCDEFCEVTVEGALLVLQDGGTPCLVTMVSGTSFVSGVPGVKASRLRINRKFVSALCTTSSAFGLSIS